MLAEVSTVTRAKIKNPRINILPVKSPSQMEQVYRLHHDNYVALGYHQPEDNGMLNYYKDFDWHEDTQVYSAIIDEQLVGTISSTVVKKKSDLPLDPCFCKDAYKLLDECGQFSLIWRLMTKPKVRSNFKVVTKMINAIMEHNLSINKVKVMVCTVHQKHVSFYRRAFGLKLLANYDDIASLNNVPAAMLRWDIDQCPGQCRT